MEKNLLYQIKKIETKIMRLILLEEENLCNKMAPKPTQFQIMEYMLNQKKDVVYQKDLEQVLGLRRATISGVLKTMEKNHFIKRMIDEKDTRIKKVVLEENAKKVLLKHKEKIKQLEKVLTENISSEEQKEFLRILKKMQENIEKEGRKENVKIN